MADSIFTRIINRDIPAHFVYEDEQCVVILDKFPTVTGQSLVIPKTPADYLFTLDAGLYQHLLTVAKMVVHASDAAFDTTRTCLVVEGFDVPHVHIKLYPMKESDRPLGERLAMGTEADDETLQVLATQLIAALGKKN